MANESRNRRFASQRAAGRPLLPRSNGRKDMSASLKGRSVLVTGGSKGIGKGIARAFAEAGAKVAVVARHPDQAETAAREIGPDAFGLGGDVTSLASMNAAMGTAAARNGGLDVLCANAGIFPPAKLE